MRQPLPSIGAVLVKLRRDDGYRDVSGASERNSGILESHFATRQEHYTTRRQDPLTLPAYWQEALQLLQPVLDNDDPAGLGRARSGVGFGDDQETLPIPRHVVGGHVGQADDEALIPKQWLGNAMRELPLGRHRDRHQRVALKIEKFITRSAPAMSRPAVVRHGPLAAAVWERPHAHFSSSALV